MSRPIEYDDLPPEVRARVPKGIKVGERSPLLAARGAETARKRQRVGKELETTLSLQHREYELQRRASIHRVHPPTFTQTTDRQGPVLRYRRRRADELACDYAGWALIDGRRYGILFDLKSWTPASYTHEPSQLVQLQELLEKRAPDVLTFLLLINRALTPAVGYLIAAEPALRMLLAGQEVLLRQAVYGGAGSGKREARDATRFAHFFPHFCVPLLHGSDAFDWLTRLETLITDGR